MVVTVTGNSIPNLCMSEHALNAAALLNTKVDAKSAGAVAGQNVDLSY